MEMGRDVAEIPRGLNLFMWGCFRNLADYKNLHAN